MAIAIGIDIGSAFSKGVLIDDGTVQAFVIEPSGGKYQKVAESILKSLQDKYSPVSGDALRTAATGTGAANVSSAGERQNEIICTARGVHNLFPDVRTVIEVAAQSTKAIRMDSEGRVSNFAATEKCATGSGRFVEVIAHALRVRLEEFGPMSLKSENPVVFSTGCAVFGESEAITRISAGVPKEDIAAGVNKALAGKILSLLKKVKVEMPCVLCGGGALNVGLVAAIRKELGTDLVLLKTPQIVTALGAALLAGGMRPGENPET